MRRITALFLGTAAFLGFLATPAGADSSDHLLGNVNVNAVSSDLWHANAAPERNGLVVLP
ncbi:hypothetical protein [Streptomyces orinoci]|uniref:Secreted protein n=1 Tax=Streptomyces orinoci TaxID=67339 RepID=A0ABV3JTH6_STRON|nr:hypothetical protein [Streptomyces orinoci]